MGVCLPAHVDCKECSGTGQTWSEDGCSHACETCWERNVGAWLKPQMPAILTAFDKAAQETPFARMIIK